MRVDAQSLGLVEASVRIRVEVVSATPRKPEGHFTGKRDVAAGSHRLASAGATGAFAHSAATELMQKGAFIRIEKLRELSLAWLSSRQTFGEKRKVSLAVLQLQP
jgi:ATP-dependent protease HslVU (ClpYQ) peptidase subunit